MNKALIIAVAVLVLLGGGVAFAMMNKQRSSEVRTPMNADNSETTMMEVKSLRDVLALGDNQTCSFSDTTTGNSGIVYVESGSMRGDFTSMVNGTSTNSHMVIKDDIFYVWTDGQPTGFKSSLTQLENLGSNPNAPKTIDINQQFNYECSPSNGVTGNFVVPADVEFMDMTSLMESIPTMYPSMNQGTGQGTNPGASNQCAACNNLSGDTKAQCLQTLNCL